MVYLENKRYTMRDIGKLEDRLANVEYYTSLSLLENKTATGSPTRREGQDMRKSAVIAGMIAGVALIGLADTAAAQSRTRAPAVSLNDAQSARTAGQAVAPLTLQDILGR